MKKLFCLIFFVFSLNFSVVSAVGDVIVMPKKETQEDKQNQAVAEFEAAKKMSQFALYSTDDYRDIIIQNLALVAVDRVQDYKKILARVSGSIESSSDSDAKYCSSFTEAILVERVAILEAYINFAKCYSAKDAVGCKNYNSQVKYRGERAAKLRQEFFEVFGF